MLEEALFSAFKHHFFVVLYLLRVGVDVALIQQLIWVYLIMVIINLSLLLIVLLSLNQHIMQQGLIYVFHLNIVQFHTFFYIVV
jgi:hypothetical protein